MFRPADFLDSCRANTLLAELDDEEDLPEPDDDDDENEDDNQEDQEYEEVLVIHLFVGPLLNEHQQHESREVMSEFNG